MVTGQHIAETAINSGLIGTPYSQMDCQAFVEVVLKKAGLNIINYRGSNQMWRELVYDRGPISNHPPIGSLAFIVKSDGGEKKRGYYDNYLNATHVAIVIDSDRVMESTTGGVQYGKLSRFTNYGLIKDVDYTEKEGGGNNAGQGRAEALRKLVSVLQDNITELEDFINANF